jgi:preprotein translocase subunit SecE
MNTKVEKGPDTLDAIKLAVAAIVAVGGFVGYYWWADESVLLRALGLFAGLVLGVVIAFQSVRGKQAWEFIKGSQVELRKVVWPSQQETLNTTLVVLVFTVVLAGFFFLVDLALLNFTQFVTGRGG